MSVLARKQLTFERVAKALGVGEIVRCKTLAPADRQLDNMLGAAIEEWEASQPLGPCRIESVTGVWIYSFPLMITERLRRSDLYSLGKLRSVRVEALRTVLGAQRLSTFKVFQGNQVPKINRWGFQKAPSRAIRLLVSEGRDE